MAMDVYMFDVYGSSKRFQGVVIKTVQRSHQPQVLGNSLCQGLGQSVVLDGQVYITTEQTQGLELVIVIESIAFAAAQNHQADEFSADLQRCDALEQLRRDVAIGTQKIVVVGRVEHDGAAGYGQSMHVPGK